MNNISYRTRQLDIIGVINAIMTASGWGMVGIFIQLLPNFSIFTIITARLAIALIGVVAWLLLQNKFFTQIQELRQLKVWILALLMLFVYISGTFAFQMASVGEVALLAATAPIFVILLRLWQKKPITLPEFGGAAIAFLGVNMVMFSNINIVGSDFSLQRILGDFLALLVSVLVALYATYFRLLSQQNKAPSSVGIGLATFILGCSIFCPIALQSISTQSNLLDGIGVKEMIIFWCLGLVSTAVPTLCSATASKRLPPLIATSVSLFEPILAIIFAFFILGEIPSALVFPGAVLVIVGLFSMGMGKKRLKSAKPVLLSTTMLQKLTLALQSQPKGGGIWTGIKVARWIERETNITLVQDGAIFDQSIETIDELEKILS